VIETRRGLGLGGFIIISVFILVVVGVAGIFPFRQLVAQERAVELAEAQLDALAVENRRLEYQISALQTDQEIERLAREHFGLVMPGEIGYVAIVPDDVIDPVLPGRRTTLEPDRPWWSRLWDFLTGRDLGPNG
jgi:cell division protein FtsB